VRHQVLPRVGFPQQRGRGDKEGTGGKGVGSLASGALVLFGAYLPATRLDLSDCWLLPIALMAWTVNR
jgi:hypothetical protein